MIDEAIDMHLNKSSGQKQVYQIQTENPDPEIAMNEATYELKNQKFISLKVFKLVFFGQISIAIFMSDVSKKIRS